MFCFDWIQQLNVLACYLLPEPKWIVWSSNILIFLADLHTMGNMPSLFVFYTYSSIPFSFRTRPELPLSLPQAVVEGVKAACLLLLCSWWPSGRTGGILSRKVSRLRSFCHELFSFLFFLLSSLFFFFFPSDFFNDLVQGLPDIALYKALTGLKVTVLSWPPGTIGSPFIWVVCHSSWSPSPVLFSLLPCYVIFLWIFVLGFRILTLPRNSSWLFFCIRLHCNHEIVQHKDCGTPYFNCNANQFLLNTVFM